VRFTIFTLFPEYFSSPLKVSLLKRAVEKGIVTLRLVNFREFARDRHKTVDEPPYGGGPGMILKAEPIVSAFEAYPPVGRGIRIYLTPWGERIHQGMIAELARSYDEVQILCGRYEGVDERVIEGWIDRNLSVGDFVLPGGESAALILIEAIARLLPGVVGDCESLKEESFASGLLEGPQYTRPRIFRGMEVPEALLSGDHKRIEAWRLEKARERTRRYRPDLLKNSKGKEPSKEDE
jgi:tRNA (guanine37-N1)-methyltransferase